MKLELGHRLSPDNAESMKAVEGMIEHVIMSALALVEAPADCIESIIIGDETEFAAAIQLLQKENGLQPGYTKDLMFQAVGKTIPLHRSGKNNSSIIFLDNCMAEIMGDLMKEPGELGIDGQHCFYAFVHEVGHCKDNLLRIDVEDLPFPIDQFRVQKIARYYIPIVLSELAACVHSSKAMTPQLYEQQVSQWQEDSRQMMQQTLDRWRAYQTDNKLLTDLAYGAAISFWNIIVQFAKLIGSQIGEVSLSAESIHWHNNNAQIFSILSEIEEAIREIWLTYPVWAEDTGQPLLNLWHKLGLANGYKFIQSTESDGVMLNAASILRSV